MEEDDLNGWEDWEPSVSESDPGEEADDESDDSGLGSDDDEGPTTVEVRVTLLEPNDPFHSVRETLVDQLCSESSKMGPNEAVAHLDFLFNQYDISSRIINELLRGQTIMDLSATIEGMMDFVRIPGYDYPEVSNGHCP